MKDIDKNILRDTSSVQLKSQTEIERASALKAQGMSIVKSKGRYWRKWKPGYYLPVHDMAFMSKEEAGRPGPLSWLSKVALAEKDAHHANSYLPVYVLEKTDGYMEGFNSKFRNQIKRSRKRCQTVVITDVSWIVEHGYEIALAQLRRTPFEPVPTKEEFASELIVNTPAVFICAFVDDKFVGFSQNFAVDGVAYAKGLYMTDEAKNLGATSALYVDFVEICQRSDIKMIVNGSTYKIAPGLDAFKRRFQFEVKEFPAYTSIHPVAGLLLKNCRPDLHRKINGVGKEFQLHARS